MQHQALFVGVDMGLGVNRQRQVQSLHEGRLDLPDQPEASPELGMHRDPADGRGPAEGVKPVSQPDIDVDGETRRRFPGR